MGFADRVAMLTLCAFILMVSPMLMGTPASQGTIKREARGARSRASDVAKSASSQPRPCLGKKGEGVPLPGEEKPDSGYLVNVSGGCPSTHRPCSYKWRQAFEPLWEWTPDRQEDLRTPWNVFHDAPWGTNFSNYAAAVASKNQTARFEALLVQHFVDRFPAMVIGEAVKLAPWAQPGRGNATAGHGAAEFLSPAWAPALKDALHRMASANGSFSTMCSTNEQYWILAPSTVQDKFMNTGTPKLLEHLEAPKKPEHDPESLWNVGPLVKACTHTLVWDTLHQNCSTLRNAFLDRLEGSLAQLYSPKHQKHLRAAYEAADRAGQLDGPTGCHTMFMPRAVPVPGAAKPKGANVLCTLMSSWTRPFSTWRWAHLQQLDAWVRNVPPRGTPQPLGGCRSYNEGPYFEDGRLFNNSNPRVVSHFAAVFRSIAPFVLMTYRGGADKGPWDDHGYGRTAWQVKQKPWKDTIADESWTIAQDRNPDASALVEMPEMLAWFTSNPSFKHPKLHNLPAGPRCEKVKELGISGLQDRGPHTPRLLKLLVNFRITTGKTGCECIRHTVASTAAQRWPFATVLPPSLMKKLGFDNAAFFRLMQAFRFVLSPPGNGWDCFRTYEAIAAGAIPIVLRTGTVSDTLYEDLPVLYVNTYDDVTEELLDREWRRMQLKARSFDFSRLSTEFWVDRIRSVSASSAATEPNPKPAVTTAPGAARAPRSALQTSSPAGDSRPTFSIVACAGRGGRASKDLSTLLQSFASVMPTARVIVLADDATFQNKPCEGYLQCALPGLEYRRLDDVVSRLEANDSAYVRGRKLFKTAFRGKRRFTCSEHKMLLHHLLPDLDTVVNIDFDILLQEDATPLWQAARDAFSKRSDDGAERLFAVTRESEGEWSGVGYNIMYPRGGRNTFHGRWIGASGANTGVMAVNLAGLRRHNASVAEEIVVSLRGAPTDSGEQDFFNTWGHENPSRIVLLPCKWNRRVGSGCNASGGMLHGNRKVFEGNNPVDSDYMFTKLFKKEKSTYTREQAQAERNALWNAIQSARADLSRNCKATPSSCVK